MGKSFKLPMDQHFIEQCIPHRYPMLLIDCVTELELNKRIVALKNVSSTDPILQGHFPGNPIFPGVLLVEAMAQASGVLGFLSVDGDIKDFLLTEISESRFKKKVIPGDVVEFRIMAEKSRGKFYWFSGSASTKDGVCAMAKFSAYLNF